MNVSAEMIKKILRYRWLIYIMVAIAYFIVYFHRTSTAVMAQELSADFGLTPMALGLFGSMYFYAYAMVQLPAGILADRWGARKTISIFVLLAGMGAALFAFSANFHIALIGRFIVGLGVGFVYVPAVRLMSDWFRKNEFGTYSGLLVAIGNAGSLASAVPLVLLMGVIGWRNSMLAVGIVSMMVAMVIYAVVRNKPKDLGWPSLNEVQGEDDTAESSNYGILASLKPIIKNYNIWTIIVTMSAMQGSLMGFQGLWAGPYLANVMEMSSTSAGSYLMLVAVGMIVGAPTAGLISDRVMHSRKKVVLIGLTGFIIIWCYLVFMTGSLTLAMLRVILFLFGFFAGFSVILYANCKENIDPQSVGTGVGFLNVFVFLVGALYQQIMGIIINGYEKVGGLIPPTAFHSAFLLCLISLVVAALFYLTQKENLAPYR